MNSIEFSKRITRKYGVKQKRLLFTALVLLKYPAGFSKIIFRQNKFAYSLNFTYQLINNAKYSSRLDANNEMYLKTMQKQKSILNVLQGSILNWVVNLPPVSKSNLSALSNLSRNTLIRAFKYTNSIFEKTEDFEGRVFSSISGPEKLFLNLLGRYSSEYKTGITYPISSPAYSESRFQLSTANYFLTHNSFLARDNAGQGQFINRSDWKTADKRIKGFARGNGQTKEMTTGINQRTNKYFSVRLESKYRVDGSHEQSFFNKQDSLINNLWLPVVLNAGKPYDTGGLTSSGSKESGAHDNNYGTGSDLNPSIFNNREPLIKINNLRQSAVHKNNRHYTADSRKGGERDKSGSSNKRFGYLKTTASFSIPGESVKPFGYRELISNYVFNLRHMDKTPGFISDAVYPGNGYFLYYSSIFPSFKSINYTETERTFKNIKRSLQQPEVHQTFFPRLEMAVNQADRRQVLSRNEAGAEVTARELIRKTSAIDTPAVDVNGIAEQVYGVIMRKIRLEKERRGK
jgi:hypothetical protein